MSSAAIGVTIIDDSGRMHVRNWPVTAPGAELLAIYLTAELGDPDEMISTADAMHRAGARSTEEDGTVYLVGGSHG